MVIAFWSPFQGQSGTTSNILVTTMAIGMHYRKQCLLTQTHFNHNNMEAPLVGSNSNNTDSLDYFRDIGLDALIRSFKAGMLNAESIDNCCIAIPNTNISLLPGTVKKNQHIYEQEMKQVYINMLRTINEHMGLVMIDLCPGTNAISLEVIKEADLLVVNLNQNMGFVDYYLNKCQDYIDKKVFYLFGNYDNNSKYNIHNIRTRFKRYVNKHNSGVIPHNTAFNDAQCDNKLVDFILDNIYNSKDEENAYFMEQIKLSAGRILTLSGAK